MLVTSLLIINSLLVGLVAQDSYLTAPLAYLPRLWIGWLLLALTLPVWLWSWRKALSLSLIACGYLWLVMGWQLPKSPSATTNEGFAIKAAFANCGDQNKQAWQQWMQQTQPDVVALVDTRLLRDLAPGHPMIAGLPHLKRHGSHVLASRHPILDAHFLPPGHIAGKPHAVNVPASRFRVATPAGEIAIYVVHLSSPRSALSKYKSPQLWKWTLLGTPDHIRPSVTIDNFWQVQEATLNALLAAAKDEELPALFLGDFNLPDTGPRYRRLANQWQDTHLAAGSGYGYTFPGDVKHWAAFSQPWMRIDYIFTDQQNWFARSLTIQDNAADSQHRGLISELVLNPSVTTPTR